MQALSFIPSDDRDIWVRCGMAIKAELGNAGFDIWDGWSAANDKYQARDAAIAWKSFESIGGVGIGTLFHIAQQYGYVCDGDNKSTSKNPEEIAIRDSTRKVDAKLQAYRREAASKEATSHWNKPANTLDDTESLIAFHTYLRSKCIKSHGAKVYRGRLIIGEMECNGALMIPMRLKGKITGLQFINGEGEKRFYPGAEKGGYLIGRIKKGKPIYICEGFATGASIHEATGWAVIVAFDAGNLRKIAQALRADQPEALIKVCADDDLTGTGERKAIEAAQAVGGVVVIPNFGDNRPEWATDFNDMMRLCGKQAVKYILSATEEKTEKDNKLQAKDSSGGEDQRTVELLRASDLDPMPISWLWESWLAEGKVHILGGAPGTGKTTIGIALAAIVTTGGRWPDDTRCSTAGNVAMWSGEDDPADTLVPRLELAGADLNRVYFIKAVRKGNEKRSFDPAIDMEPLQRKLVEIGDVRLLIIDPIVSAIAGDSHKNAEVRRGLQPLANLAVATRCALLGITHFSKGTGGREPVERITGSLAFGAVARVVMVAAKHQEENDVGDSKRLLLRAKSNIGPDDGGFEYQLKQAELEKVPGIWASKTVWGATVEGEARDLLAQADAIGQDTKGSALAQAEGFLLGILAKGPMPSAEIETYAKKVNCSDATIRRAKKTLHIEARKKGGNFGGGKQQWEWVLPTAEGAQGDQIPQDQHKSTSSHSQSEDAQQKNMSPFSKIEPLQQADELIVEEL